MTRVKRALSHKREEIHMYIIDRFEGDFAVVENGDVFENIPRSVLPENASEGDVIVFDGEKWSVNTSETKLRRARIREKMNRLTGNS